MVAEYTRTLLLWRFMAAMYTRSLSPWRLMAGGYTRLTMEEIDWQTGERLGRQQVIFNQGG